MTALRAAASGLFYTGFRVFSVSKTVPLTGHSAGSALATIVCDGVVNPRLRLHWNATTGKLSCTHAGALMLLK